MLVEISPSNIEGTDSISVWGAKIPHASRPKNQNIKKKKQKQYCNKFNKDFKNDPYQKNLFEKSYFINALFMPFSFLK